MSSRKGIPNRNKRFLMNRLQDMYGDDFYPIMKMAANAARLQGLVDNMPDDETASLFTALKTSIDAWEKIAQYTDPKLKAVDLSGFDGEKLDTKWTVKLVRPKS